MAGAAYEGVDEVRSAVHYAGRAADAVRGLKFDRRTALAAPMAELVAREAVGIPYDAVAAVPIHWTRRAERGFNQAEMLAEEIPGPRAVLSRVRRTTPQFALDPSRRRENVRGAFRAKGVTGLRVLLVDDVATSGGTLTACAEALREAGAAEVRAVLFARAG